MLKDRYSYIAIFTYETDKISIEFPNLHDCHSYTVKDNTNEALKNTRKSLELHNCEMKQKKRRNSLFLK